MSEQDIQDEKYCSNCKKHIAAGNFVMHEMHCKRHIILCKICKEPVPRSEEEEHFDTYHAEVDCQLCKMKIEKDKLDEHMETDCPNKPSKCSYCELEMPQCDVRDHEGYCGTRTEPCLTCEQYVMIKDFNRHIDSGCTYPTPKPPVPSAVQNQPFFDRSFMDPFSFDEIHRILDEARVPSTSNLAALQSLESGNRFQTPPRHVVRNNTSDRSHKNTTNRRSEVNKQKDLSSSSPNTQYDSMLSQMLGAAHGSTEDLSHYLPNLQRESEVVPNTLASSGSSSSSPNHDNTDEFMLPCEFCDDLFPSDSIIQHQSGCDPLSSGMWSTTPTVTEGQNNTLQSQLPIHRSTAFIPVINNLDNNRQRESVDIETDRVEDDYVNDHNVLMNYGDDLDEVMIPCEFCSELFPTDMLVLHQSVCDSNTTVTPRVMTPATAYQPKLKPADRIPRNYVTDLYSSTSRASRRQPPPSLDRVDPETIQNNNKSDRFFEYDHSLLTNNGRRPNLSNDKLPTHSKPSNNRNRQNGKSSKNHESNATQDLIERLLQEDLEMPITRESAKNIPVDSNRMNGAAGGADVRRKKSVPVSARKVVQELDKNEREKQKAPSQRNRSTRGVRNDENKTINNAVPTSRHRSTHLLNADTSRAPSNEPSELPQPRTQRKKSSPKPRNQQRR